jgi:hypothetical protein
MKKGLPAMDCFNTFSRPFTEWYLLDPVTCRIVNHPQADQMIRPPCREGWKL